MPTKKKEAAEAPLAPRSRVYDQSVEQYAAAMELLRKGDFSAARDQFVEICKLAKDEPELSERAATYARICNQRLDPSVQEPVGFEENYHRAVMLSNQLGGTIFGESEPVRVGRRVTVIRTRITGDNGRLLAEVTTTHVPIGS